MRSVITGSICLAMLALAVPAHATLGGKAASIETDRARLNARIASRLDQATYSVHEMTLESGTTAREFIRPDGTVFAVSWQGPQRPNLKQLFGDSYFNRFQADNKANPRIRMRRGLASSHSDFVVRTGGHSGAFWGFAYLPQTAPGGFPVQALQGGAQ
ncbi:DUF2844 domain-containing protein [Asticcacaulis taihuensis]|uniref:DUF2844 domain-containing protein n=1 Tax=Asticcacaulis taihuensis TaxID=260084 RepID=A0A1G4QT37_9CAUL|nr:DUF2844 domain-containing protein [Asticcacaulis taihuensis]SCW47780.1 Protein of unknown function [Asticcacaulis taihuensis]